MGKGRGKIRAWQQLRAPWLLMAGHRAGQGLLLAVAWLTLGVSIAHAETTTTVTYVYTNAQGTPLAKADAQGNIIARYSYRPYGTQQSGPTNTGPGYTGHVNDPDTGLVYMQQRYYDPIVGRFISPDPVAPAAGNVFNFGRYTYANDNPILFTDPDGRQGKVAWLVRLAANGMRKVARLTREQAIHARRAGQNVVADRRQIGSGIERAAHGTDGQLKHAAHELKDGSKGLPHYQTKGKSGHTFWGKISVVAASVASALDQAANAAEYIPDPVPRPATQEDIDRTNDMIDAVSDYTGIPFPDYPDIPEDRTFPFPETEPESRNFK